MDPLSLAGTTLQVTHLTLDIFFYYISATTSSISYLKLYGISGLLVWLFGNNDVWYMQAEVLGSMKDEDAFTFRQSIRNECNMEAVAGAIVAQIAITALSLVYLSQTHWVARALWIFSLISGLMTVRYALAQQREMGRLLNAGQIRAWIRGAPETSEPETIVKALEDKTATLQPGSDDYQRLEQAFPPGQASVITVSAPEQLLSVSLSSLLSGLGVYLAFIWRRDLDTNAGTNDSKNVFIIFTVSVVVCYAIYSLSSIVKDGKDTGSPSTIVQTNFEHFIASHPLRYADINVDKDSKAMRGEKGDGALSGQSTRQPRGHEDLEASAADLWASVTDPLVRLRRTSPADEALIGTARGQPYTNRWPRTTIETELNNAEPVRERVGVMKYQGTIKDSSALLDHEQLIRALQESARLRRESAKVDELVAQYHEQLSRR